jgi:hypothetical protein
MVELAAWIASGLFLFFIFVYIFAGIWYVVGVPMQRLWRSLK